MTARTLAWRFCGALPNGTRTVLLRVPERAFTLKLHVKTRDHSLIGWD